MIKRKLKFTQSINFNEYELGSKTGLFGSGNDGHPGIPGVVRKHPEQKKQDNSEKDDFRGVPKTIALIKESKDNQSVKQIDGQIYVNGIKVPQPVAPEIIKNTNLASDVWKKETKIEEAKIHRYQSEVVDANGTKDMLAQFDLNDKNYKSQLDLNLKNYNLGLNKNQKELDAAKVQLTAIKMQQDPYEISQTEMEVFKLVQKYDLFNTPDAFKKMDKVDAYELENDLKNLGANLTVDGIINENTVTAVEALISKNAPAIKAYKEVTGIDLLRPNKPKIER